ncbi:hypothetical protein GCM10010439_03470 [Actinocorallia aurantiaca]|uniref:Mannosyltransferase PIG-V n=1 Tax=Actinocorallia aurantiaca TaxID=46204 RepID=A0ABN3TTU6_9ACTN
MKSLIPQRTDRAALGTWVLAYLAAAWFSIVVIRVIPHAGDWPDYLTRWNQWDADRFWWLATYGYDGGPPGRYEDYSWPAFFPGYPMAIRVVGLIVTDYRAAGLVISFLAGPLAALALSRLTDFSPFLSTSTSIRAKAPRSRRGSRTALPRTPSRASEDDRASEAVGTSESPRVPEVIHEPGETRVSESGLASEAAHVSEGGVAPEAVRISKGGVAPETARAFESASEAFYAHGSGLASEGVQAPEGGRVSEGVPALERGHASEGTHAPEDIRVSERASSPEGVPASEGAPSPLEVRISGESPDSGEAAALRESEGPENGRLPSESVLSPGSPSPAERVTGRKPVSHRLHAFPAARASSETDLRSEEVSPPEGGPLEEGRRRPGPGFYAVVALVTSPCAVFLFAAYSEALFLALAIPAWLLAKKGRWELAVLCAAGASIVRITGLFLALGLIVEFLVGKNGRKVPGGWRNAPYLVTPFLSIGAYMGYQWYRTGDPLAWQHAQEQGWNRHTVMPWEAFQTTWYNAFTIETEWSNAFRVEIIAAFVGVLLVIWLLYSRQWPETVYVSTQLVAFMTSSFYLSIGRATLLWFPLWMALGHIMSRHRWFTGLYLALSLPLAAAFVASFTQGQWTG